MPKLGANLADISTAYEVMPEGMYPALLKKVTEDISKSSKIPMLVVEFSITEGDFKGRPMTQYYMLKDKDGQPSKPGLSNFKRLIENTLGEDRANDPDFDTDELLDQEVELFVKQESYKNDAGEDVPSNKIKKVLGSATPATAKRG